MSGHLAPAVVLEKRHAHQLLEYLAPLREDDPTADELFRRVYRAWEFRGINHQVVVALNKLELLHAKQAGFGAKQKLVRYRFLAIYSHPDTDQEVRVKSQTRPAKRRTFKVPGQGRKKFTRRKLYSIPTTHKESSNMARSRKTKATRDEIEDDLDELEGLEELDEIEPDDEDVEEAPAPKKRRTRKAAPKKVVEEDEDEDDEEDEDEDEDEEPAPKRRTRSKTPTKKAPVKKATKKGTSAAGKSTKEATGGVGSAELAEAATDLAEVEITGRDVRVYLRKNGIPKDEDHGRYVWPSEKNKEFVKLAKAIAKEYGE